VSVLLALHLPEAGGARGNILLISVRTLAIRVTILAFTLASADWPKAGSYEDGERFTACKVA
jgi:hypothetical protein